MKKKLMSIGTIFAIMLLVSCSVSILSGCDNKDSQNQSYFIIADKVEGKTLVSVTEKGSNQSTLTIPNGVECIGKNAFLPSMLSLVNVNIPDSVTLIDENAFAGCINLQSVNFSKNSKLKSIKKKSFYECLSLRRFTVPKEVEEIHSYAFEDMNSYTNMKLVITFLSEKPVENFMPYGAYALIVPDGKSQEYKNIYGNESIYEQKNVVDDKYIIEDNIILRYIGLETKLTLDSKFDNAEAGFCAYNNLIEEVIIKTSKIADNAFYYCASLRKITIDTGENNLTIGDYAFYNSGLTEITIPHSVTAIGYNAFYNSYYYLKIHVKGYTSIPEGWNSNWARSPVTIEWNCQH